jgi:hypothetical protein
VIIAQWNPDPNSPKQIVSASVSPQDIHTVVNAGEGFFLIWGDKRTGGKQRILFNHYNFRGEMSRSTNGVETDGPSNTQTSPEVSDAISGKVSVAWIEETGENKRSLMVQQINSRINFSWQNDAGAVVAASPSGEVSEFSVALDRRMNTHLAYIVRDVNPSNYKIMVQRIDRNGNIRFDDGVVIEKSGSQKSAVFVLPGSSGGANVCWIDAQGGNSLIKFASVDSSGKLADEVSILATIDGIIKSFNVITLGSGDHYLVWESTGRAKEIFHQLISSKGNVRWSKGGKQAVSNQGINGSPVAIETGDSTMVMSWINDVGGDENIFLQKYDRRGNTLWGINGVTIGKIKGRQFAQTLDSDGNGGVFVSWLDRREGTTEIYAHKINSSGKEEWDEDGVPVSKSQNPEKSYLELFFDGKDGAIIVFKEKSKAGEGIYGQRLSGVRPKVQGIVDAWLTTNDDEMKINWTATNEKNVISYFIHRMEPRIKDTAWTEIDNVVADPNAQGSYYTFDAPDKEGKMIYRITQISKEHKVVSQKMVEGEFVRKTNQKIYVSQNVPNPFSDETTITYNVSGITSVKFEFYDANFKLIKDETVKVPKEGKYTYTFKSTGLADGIYFYRFTAGNYVEVKKMAIVR